ncbi:MAG: DUF1800 family protein, partial [Verrucomicrobiota bacterium]
MRTSPILFRVSGFVLSLCGAVLVMSSATTSFAQVVAPPQVAVSPVAISDPVSLVLLDGGMRTDWPDKGVVAFRRKNTRGAVNVGFAIGGTALRNVDYAVAAGNVITIPDGKREVWLEISPVISLVNKADKAVSKTITLTLTGGGTVASGSAGSTVTLNLEIATGKPGRKEAVRFLNQAAFGPDGDLQNVSDVSRLGFEGWINDQTTRPVGTLQPYLVSLGTAATSADKKVAWWNQAMNRSQTADPLRQRVGFALSEIFVISDVFGPLNARPLGMVNYYDMLLTGAFGNYRDLLYSVGLF